MSIKINPSRRLQELPPYIFSHLNMLKAEAIKKGIELTSLAIGDPDQPTPDIIVRRLQEAAANPKNHLYSPYEGTLAFRQSVSRWLRRRFSVDVNPEKEIIALIGSKEGIAHFPVAFCNPGDRALYPSPGYPVFETSIRLAGGIPIAMPHTAKNHFLPDLNVLESLLKEHQPRFMILNYPSNPTTAVVSKAILENVVALARRYQTMIVFDNAYSEIYYDSAKRPSSIMEISGAKDVAIELQSLSKTFNMTGWRLAYAFGNPEMIAALLKAKTNIDSGPLLTVQEAGAFALDNAETICPPIRDVYTKRRKVLLEGLGRIGVEYMPMDATFFVWAKVPRGQDSMEFTKELIEKQGLVITPGIGFGKEGSEFFRLAMTVDIPRIESALSRLSDYLG